MLEGLPPNGATFVMRLTADEKKARVVADFVVEIFDPGEAASVVFETAPSTLDWKSGAWTAEVFFGPEPDEQALRTLVGELVGEEAAQSLSFGRIERKDWIAASLEGLKPVRAGRFLVHGSHDRDKAKTNEIAIEIEAALAFGTGHHGTTYGCLEAIDAVGKMRRPRKILDIGTGTGVLAIAAARLWRRPVFAGDIDPVSTAAATANAKLNRAGPYLRPVVARGARHPYLQAGGPYDLILANILARPLQKLAPEIAALASADCELILSGLLARDVAGVLSAYRAQNFMLVRRTEREGWATLLLRQGG